MPERFVSEPLLPDPAAIELGGMAAGMPGLPRRFTWAGRSHEIARVLAEWREVGPERGRRGPAADRYLRRHWWQVRTTEGLELKLYCERHSRPAQRWWVYSVADGVGAPPVEERKRKQEG